MICVTGALKQSREQEHEQGKAGDRGQSIEAVKADGVRKLVVFLRDMVLRKTAGLGQSA